MARDFPWGALRTFSRLVDYWAMSLTAHPHPKPQRQPTYLKAWRKHHDYTLKRVIEWLKLEFDYELSDSQLSRIERGEQDYTQSLLDRLAIIYKTDAGSLIMRDPGRKDAAWALVETVRKMSPEQRAQAVRVIEALQRSGTEG